MTRLPPPLRPLWPMAKRLHRAGTRGMGAVVRSTPARSERAVPREGLARLEDAVHAEPDAVRVHGLARRAEVRRRPPPGSVGEVAFWSDVTTLPGRQVGVLSLEGGLLVGEFAACLTPGRRIVEELSPYFGTDGWREHPLFLGPRLPPVEHVPGTVLSLASPGSTRNYYHSLMDALPRWGLAQDADDGPPPDVVVVGHTSAWDRQLVAMLGIDAHRLVAPDRARTLRADRLVVPSLDNTETLAPPWITTWLRRALPARDVADRPRRLYVTRGHRPHTRRLVTETALWPELERRGFALFDPGAHTVQDQIDHFAAAEVVVGPHGAGLVNLNFAPEGVKVLELFAPRYLNPGYWAIAANIADSTYRCLVADPLEPDRPARAMSGVQNDVDIPVPTVLAALDELLDA